MSKARNLADVISGQYDIPAESLDNAPPSQGKNLIINGAMQVAQRGTSSTTNGYATVDRFAGSYSGPTKTQSQEALSSGDPFDEGFRNFFRMTNTDIVTNTATHYATIYHGFEAQDIASCGWNYTSESSYITLSFWVRSSVAQTFYGYLRAFDGTASLYTFGFDVSADTWTKVTKTIAGDSNLQFDNNADLGLQLQISAFWGTNFTSSGATLNSWNAFNGGSRFPDFDDTWATTDEATFDITGVQLEVGSVATPFEHRSYGEELAACQRYTRLVRMDDYGVVGPNGYWLQSQPVSPEMRASPSITTLSSNIGAGTLFIEATSNWLRYGASGATAGNGINGFAFWRLEAEL